jgi:hypothetical protein
MPERQRVAMLLLHEDSPRDLEALRHLAEAMPDADVGEPDELGVFEVSLDAADLEEALHRTWDGVAAAGADDHIVFVEHPELPEHWRHLSRRPG